MYDISEEMFDGRKITNQLDTSKPLVLAVVILVFIYAGFEIKGSPLVRTLVKIAAD